MKKLIILFLSLLIIVGCSKPINNESLIDRNGVKYEKDSQSPYTGQVFELHDNGNKSLEGNYKDGIKDGLWSKWYSSGNIEYENCKYKNGKRDGLWIEYFKKAGNKKWKKYETIKRLEGIYEEGDGVETITQWRNEYWDGWDDVSLDGKQMVEYEWSYSNGKCIEAKWYPPAALKGELMNLCSDLPVE